MSKWLVEQSGTHVSYTSILLYLIDLLEVKDLESKLRKLSFGYRAGYIAKAVKYIDEQGGEEWLNNMRNLSYPEAKIQLQSIPGIGPKV